MNPRTSIRRCSKVITRFRPLGNKGTGVMLRVCSCHPRSWLICPGFGFFSSRRFGTVSRSMVLVPRRTTGCGAAAHAPFATLLYLLFAVRDRPDFHTVYIDQFSFSVYHVILFVRWRTGMALPPPFAILLIFFGSSFVKLLFVVPYHSDVLPSGFYPSLR